MKTLLVLLTLALPFPALALEAGNTAPQFVVKDHTGKDFDLSSRKGHWTVLYFYPKSGTPGCTKQACGFRDSIKKIEVLGASVYGISTDSVEAQAKFHKEQHLNFTLLADDDAKVTKLYGAKMPVVGMAKRWTFIIDPELVIREIEDDVDPVLNAGQVIKRIKEFQAEDAKKTKK